MDEGRCDVLFLIRSMGRGGAERQLSLLARALQVRGLSVAVGVFYVGSAMEQELRAANVSILDLRKAGRWSNLGVVRRLMDFIRQRRPRVLHSYMATQNVLALLLRPWLKRRDCAVACGIRTALPNAWGYSRIAGVVDSLQALLLPHADRVISNSSLALRQLDGRIGRGRGIAIPNGIEHARFAFSADKRRSQRAAWQASDDEILLGLVGRLDPQKNHALLIDALNLAGERLSNVRLVFVGDGTAECRDAIRAHAQAAAMASRILWAGASDDMMAVYSALDMLCLCSVVEGFPNVLAEAMCAGLPCIATDVGDAAMLVGDCGWVVPSRNAQALSQALLEAHGAMPGWDREAPRRRVIEQFGVDALADRTLAALAPFLGDARR